LLRPGGPQNGINAVVTTPRLSPVPLRNATVTVTFDSTLAAAPQSVLSQLAQLVQAQTTVLTGTSPDRPPVRAGMQLSGGRQLASLQAAQEADALIPARAGRLPNAVVRPPPPLCSPQWSSRTA
jgi:hypothetical protein